MKTASLKEIKDELKHLSDQQVVELILNLSRFKKDNKELLSYLLFYSSNESGYVEAVKESILQGLSEINTQTYYWMKKTIRKVLRNTKKYIRYSKKKETEVELLLFFCHQLLLLSPSIKNNVTLWNIYSRQLQLAQKAMHTLHEDLQYDFKKEIDVLSTL